MVWGNCWKDKCELSRFVLCEWALTRPASLAEESAVKGGILQQERNSRNEEVRRPKISPLLLLKTSGLFCFLFFGCFVLFCFCISRNWRRYHKGSVWETKRNRSSSGTLFPTFSSDVLFYLTCVCLCICKFHRKVKVLLLGKKKKREKWSTAGKKKKP